MVIAQISHGLGNQLFQYAAARRLAHINQTVLKLDVYAYSQSKFRRFGLHHFNINADLASCWDIAKLCPLEALPRTIRFFLPSGLSNLVLRVLNKSGLGSQYRHRTAVYDPKQPLPRLLAGRVASERFYHFDKEVLSCPDNICLSGYWQSEKYFKDVSEVIRNEIKVKTPLSGKNFEVAQHIRSANSISLHIRRGDKVKQEEHCATSAHFCSQAIKFFRAKVTDPKFFVFTDDWEWVHANLYGEDGLIYVNNNNDETNYEDLRLMSLCKHNIIAPSSFSWWGAWLNGNEEKIVVRPKKWLNMNNHNIKDAFPERWIPLE